MIPLILMPTINSRHWNTCYLQLLSVQRCQHPPQAERSCWGGGPHPPSSRALLLGGGSRPPQQQSSAAGGGSAMGLGVQGGYRAVCGRSYPALQSCIKVISCWLFSRDVVPMGGPAVG